jgi:hypothetical protein
MSDTHSTWRHRMLEPTPRSLLALVATSALAVAQPAHAQTGDFDIACDTTTDLPCAFRARTLDMQKVPAVLKFQARISQAKLPRGDGSFGELYVKLVRGTEVLCVEQFRNIRVTDGWVNIEVGREMNCELDEVIAENNGLSFQLCPGGAENCLRSVTLAASPYATKTSFASLATEARHANLVGQANYAHRATADDDLLARNTIGLGYFDFFTPTADKATALHPLAAFEAYANSGFISWTPTRDAEALRLHIAAKSHGSNHVSELRSLHLASESTTASGDLTISPPSGGKGLVVDRRGIHVTGDSDIDGRLDLSQALTVSSGGAEITGDSDTTGELTVDSRMNVLGGGIDVTSDSDIRGELTVTQMLAVLSGGAKVAGPSIVDGTLLVHGATTISGGGLEVTGDTTLSSTLAVDDQTTVGNGLRVLAGGLRVSSGGLAVSVGDANITGDARFVGSVSAQDIQVNGAISALDALKRRHRFLALGGNSLLVNPDGTLDSTVVAGVVRFTGPVTFNAGTIDPDQAENFVLARGEIRDLVFGGGLTILDSSQFEAGIVDGLEVSGGATIRDGLSLAGGVSGSLSLSAGLTVSGRSDFVGPLSFVAGITGSANVFGGITTQTLSVTDSTTLNGAASFAGGITGPVAFSGRLALPATANLNVLGTTTFGNLTANQNIVANATASLGGANTFAGGIAGNTTFANDVSVSGLSVLNGATSMNGNLIVDGPARFNGAVSFGGSFAGTTTFENVNVTKNLTVASTSTFTGPVSFTNGIAGSLALSSATISSGLKTSGWSVFEGVVSLTGSVSGLDNLPSYVKITGEDRALKLGPITTIGNVSIQGSLTLVGGLSQLNASSLQVMTSLVSSRDTEARSVWAGRTVNVMGKLVNPRCRVCINYSDNLGNNAVDHKHACVKLSDGEGSGMMQLSGDVNGDDVFAISYVCDGGPSETGSGWVF